MKKLTLILLTLSLLLSGCGNSQNNNSDNSENKNPNNSNNNFVEKDEYSLSEYISKGETIWFLTDGYGKDDKIKQIFVFDANGNLYYCDCDWKIGEAEPKEDSEIIAYVKQEYEKEMTEAVNKAMSWQGKTFDDYARCISDTATLFSPYLNNIKPAQYKFSVITDSTGNNTEREVIAYQEFAPIFFDWGSFKPEATITYIELSYIYPYEGNHGTTNCFEVYDSWYGAYAVNEITSYSDDLNESHKTKWYFLTRINSSKHFTPDEVGTTNIGIDNADSLFEKIFIDLEWEQVPEEY